MKETSTKERLQQFVEYLGISNRKFCRSIGVSPAYIATMVAGIGREKLRTIQTVYPMINLDWLEKGEGDMLINENPQTPACAGETNLITNQTPNVFDARVFECGFPSGESGAITHQTMNNVLIVPDMPSDIIYVRAHGNSMVSRDASLSIPDGSFVAIRKLQTNIIRWGEIYALATRDGMVIKRILPDSENADAVRCVSLNSEDYPEFKISKQDIIDMAIVVAVVTIHSLTT